uniref:Endonuclease/exonuclease/phosphatase domain-containing protein n=1 Tax=Chelonoidis abingdonii TaxID=106734 RepID=A0A8C0HBC0_CHEAB
MCPLALLLLGLRLAGASFKICAFNTQGFGEAKYWTSQDPWVPLGSRRLGHGTYKEQIIFVYRFVIPVTPQQHPSSPVLSWGTAPPGWGSSSPEGRYPPLTAPPPPPAIKDFVLLSHHASPRNAPHEIHQLHRVCQELSQRWETQNVMVLGDLNAGGPYVPPSAWGSIQLRWDPRFHWLISDGVDTTVRARTHCAYDRYCPKQLGVPAWQGAETPPAEIISYPLRERSRGRLPLSPCRSHPQPFLDLAWPLPRGSREVVSKLAESPTRSKGAYRTPQIFTATISCGPCTAPRPLPRPQPSSPTQPGGCCAQPLHTRPPWQAGQSA